MSRDREMPPILLLSRLKGSQLAAQMPHAKEEAVLGAKTFPGHTVMAAEQGELPCPLRDMVTGRHLARLRLLGGVTPASPHPAVLETQMNGAPSLILGKQRTDQGGVTVARGGGWRK